MHETQTTENAYVARLPIVGPTRKTVGYRLLFRDGWVNARPNVSSDLATSRLIVESHLDLGLEKLVGRNRAFINFSERTLLDKYPLLFHKDKIIVEVPGMMSPSPEIIEACRELKSKGYRLAMDDSSPTAAPNELVELADIVKLDISQLARNVMKARVDQLVPKEKDLLAETVQTYEQFTSCRDMGFDMFQGYFIAKPETLENRKLANNKVVMMQLMAELSNHPLNFAKVSELIARDAGMSIRLLKVINSPAFGVAQGINSLQHAMTYLGEEEMRKFISLIAMASLGDEKPAELLNMATIRARFAELLMRSLGDEEKTGSAFLSGLFSLVEAIMNEPLSKIFQQIPVDKEIKDAVLDGKSDVGKLLQLVLAYEKGDWPRVNELNIDLELSKEVLGESYREAISWARSFESSI